MKKLFSLLLFAVSVFNMKSIAQTTVTCNANFTFTISAFTAQFSSTMPGDSISTVHYWSFGDGTTLSAVNPLHTFAIAGTYNVKHYLIKRNPNGLLLCSDSIIKTIIITSPYVCNLQSYFSWRVDSTNSLKYIFTNQSTPISSTDSIKWTFGDGTSSLDLNATHLYANAGTYNVCLRIKKNVNPAGTTPCVNEYCKSIVVTIPCTLQANYTWHLDSLNIQKVWFVNNSLPISTADSILWSFGDNTTSTNYNPDHLYTHAGTYNVCLKIKKNNTASGAAPCVSEICKTITITAPCTFLPNYSTVVDSINSKKINFNNSTILPNTPTSVNWYFGDGSSATTWNATHEYAQAGKYYVCLRIEASPNCVRYKCDSVSVIATPPLPPCNNQSNFTFTKLSTNSQAYTFTPDFLNSSAQYTWTFGDGTGSHDVVANHNYASAGSYTTCLTVWRSATCASTTCKSFTVTQQLNCDSIHIGYTNQKDPIISNKVYFYANANWPMIDQTWTITRATLATTPPVILHQNNPIYTFSDTGYFRVCLKVISLGGCVKEYCSLIHIERLSTNICTLQTYPSPANSVINISVPLTQPQLINVYIYNALNVLVKQQQQQGINGSNILSVNINDLTSGTYTIRAVYGTNVCYSKFNKL